MEDGGSGKRLGDSEQYFWDYNFPEWTGQEDDAFNHVEMVGALGEDKIEFAGNYEGPLYAPYKKMPPIKGLDTDE